MTQPKSNPWRWLLVLPLAISVVVALIGCVYVFNGVSATGWKKTEATIVESGFPLKYEFTVDGKRHTGSVVSHSFINLSDEELQRRYPVGQQVTVHYAPSEDTYLSVLEPGFHIDSILVTLLALVFAFLWWKGMRPSRQPPEQETRESEPPAET